MPPAVHWRTSIIGAFAMVTALNDAVDWLDETLLELDQNRKLLKTLLAELLPEVDYQIPESSYLAWLNLAAFGENNSWHDQLISQGKVAIVPGQDFGKQYKNYARLNFATYPEVLIEGVKRLKLGLA
jgi:cystathionine beta-lyase